MRPGLSRNEPQAPIIQVVESTIHWILDPMSSDLSAK